MKRLALCGFALLVCLGAIADTGRASAADNNVDTVPNLVFTEWRFNGADTIVEFLPGGKITWNGAATKGFWKQSGNTVVINVNDFTQFDLTVNGDKMEGTWTRLQGADKGRKFPSGLQRVVF